MGFKSFEEIEAWKEARTLVNWIQTICKKENVCKNWAWIDQITRSSISIMANIAEGCDTQTNAEFCQFLGYAKRSASETRSHLYYALDSNFINKEEFDTYGDITKKIGSQLSNLIKYLRQNDKRTTFTA
ncbi:MAG: four helix bundle protein [Kiritimatiellales bacterium]|nr:four helix bundle protein [Kiritimatiellales bacterium]